MADKKSKKHRYYLIDYENVNKAGLAGIETLHKTDTVVIFYSENADSLSFELHTLLGASKASVSYIKVDTQGKNALDFQLSSYIGYLLGKDEHCRCYIVSNDKGYLNVQDFWKKRGGKIKMIPCIHNCTESIGLKKPALLEALSGAELTPEEQQQAADVVRARLKMGASDLTRLKICINNDLLHVFGSEKTKLIYRVIKPLLR